MNARGHLSSETIDLLMLSALDAAAANAAKGHLDGCDVCRTRWRELNEDKERFVQFVFPRTVDKVSSRVMAPSFFERLRIIGPWKVLTPALGAVLAASVAAVVYLGGPGTQTEDEIYIGLKGGKADVAVKADPRIALSVVAQRPVEGQFPVTEGAVLRPGDKLQFVVNAGSAKFLLIGSRDGAGAFNIYHPFGGQQSASIERGEHQLPGAIELDEVAGRERLVAVFSAEPIDAQALKLAVETNPRALEFKDAKVISLEFVKAAKK